MSDISNLSSISSGNGSSNVSASVSAKGVKGEVKAKNSELLNIARAPIGKKVMPSAGSSAIISIPAPVGKPLTAMELTRNLKMIADKIDPSIKNTRSIQVVLEHFSDPDVQKVANKMLAKKFEAMDSLPQSSQTSQSSQSSQSSGEGVKVELNEIQAVISELKTMIDKMPQNELKAYGKVLQSERDEFKSEGLKKVQKLEKAYKKMAAALKKEAWMKPLGWIGAVGMVVAGLALTVFTGGAAAPIGAALLVGGAATLTKQIVATTDPKFMKTKGGKWFGFAMDAIAAGAMIAGAVVTGGATIWVGLSVFGAAGGIGVDLAKTIMETGTKKQQAELKADQKKHVFMALEITFAALGLIGGVGASVAAKTASSAAEAAEEAESTAAEETADVSSRSVESTEATEEETADVSSRSVKSTEALEATEAVEVSSNVAEGAKHEKLTDVEMKEFSSNRGSASSSNKASVSEKTDSGSIAQEPETVPDNTSQLSSNQGSASSSNKASVSEKVDSGSIEQGPETASENASQPSLKEQVRRRIAELMSDEDLVKAGAKVAQAAQLSVAASGAAKAGLDISVNKEKLSAAKMKELASKSQANMERINAFMEATRDKLQGVFRMQQDMATTIRDLSKEAAQTANYMANLS